MMTMRATLCLTFLLLKQISHAFSPQTSFSKSLHPYSHDRRILSIGGLEKRRRRREHSQLSTLFQEPEPSPSSQSTPAGKRKDEVAQPVCRIVTRAGSKLPMSTSRLLSDSMQSQELVNKLDDYFSATAHRETKWLHYLNRETSIKRRRVEETEEAMEVPCDPAQEKKLVRVLRNSLEDAGFELLSRRDIDLCDCLNAEYLLRLSIVPDVGALDGSIAKEFYPERFHTNGTVIDKDELLFDGRVLVYWRGYSEEVTRGRLLLPKLDYLQASLVQRSAAWVKRRLDSVESSVSRRIRDRAQKLRTKAKESVDRIADSVPEDIGSSLRRVVQNELAREAAILPQDAKGGRFKLGRYGGSKVRFVGSPDPTDALQPFMICEVPEVPTVIPDVEGYNASCVSVAENAMKDEINQNLYTCQYDERIAQEDEKNDRPRMELLERVSINNLVDFSSKSGRRKMIGAILQKSELVEPTYEEVVVVWRPKREKKRELRPPKLLSDFADMFDIEGFDQPKKKPKVKRKPDIEIRNFEGVPMANLPAVLPKTKLIFRPADAFLFDMISFVTFLLVLGSVRLDSPRLDLLALVSVTLWTLRTVFRYSNKLARYDLLVKTFLTSKISHRNAGALKYISSEAGVQRAIRTSLVYYWILNFVSKIPFRPRRGDYVKRAEILEKCQDSINSMLKTEKEVQLQVERSLDDLEKLRMIRFDEKDKRNLVEVSDPASSLKVMRANWIGLYESGDDSDDDPSHGSRGKGIDTGSTNKSSSDSSDQEEIDRGVFEIDNESVRSRIDFDERRNRLRSLLEQSRQLQGNEVAYGWQQGLSTQGCLQPAFEVPSGVSVQGMQGGKRWYF